MNRSLKDETWHESETVLARTILFGALLLGTVLRFYLIFTDDGIYWPDEVYQSLEPAHRWLFGYGLVAWEFVEGARNWAMPGLVVGLFKLSTILGLDSPREYLSFAKAFFAVVGVATAYGSYRLAKTCGASDLSAAMGAALMALVAPGIYFSPRAMSETAAALPVVFGFAYGLQKDLTRGEHLLGAALLGLSVFLRLQSGIFCVGFLGILLARRQWRRTGECFAVLLSFAVLFGLLDHLTWANAPGARFGGWFHSAMKYLQFNLIDDRARDWGVAPWYYYFATLFRAMPAPLLLIGSLSVFSFLTVPQARGLFLAAITFVALHACMPHKELRFIMPALPLFCALAAVGLSALRYDSFRWAATAAVLLAALVSAIGFHRLTFGDLGQYPSRAGTSAYDDFGPVNRMLLAAHDRPDICGVHVDLGDLAWTGGYSYLHRRVPLYDRVMPPPSGRAFNYVVTLAQPNQPGQVVASDTRNSRIVLVRVADACEPDSHYSWRLP